MRTSLRQPGRERERICGAPPHLLLHSSGALICSVGRRKEPFGQRAYVSYDGGETWTRLGRATGENGQNGKDGQDGKNGSNGSNGSDGSNGNSGSNPWGGFPWG